MSESSPWMVVIEEDVAQMLFTLARAGATLDEATAALDYWLTTPALLN